MTTGCIAHLPSPTAGDACPSGATGGTEDEAMVSRIRLLALILTVPLIGLLVFEVIGPPFIAAAALWAGLAGIALLLGIRLAGSAARNSRTLLAVLFRPGLYVTGLVVVTLVLVHALLAMATMKQVSHASLLVNPADAAITFITNAEKVEEEISGAYQAVLARELGLDTEGTSESDEENT